MDTRLPRWFRNRLKKIMEHNGYTEDMVTVSVCNKEDKWTPTDLVLREWYNNGGGGSKGFLGITTSECERCYEYIKTHSMLLKDLDMYNAEGVNNWGFTLWTNYEVH